MQQGQVKIQPVGLRILPAVVENVEQRQELGRGFDIPGHRRVIVAAGISRSVAAAGRQALDDPLYRRWWLPVAAPRSFVLAFPPFEVSTV